MQKRIGIIFGYLIACMIAVVVPATAQSTSDDGVKEIIAHRAKQQREMLDKVKSPLTSKDLKKFKGLNYYPIDLAYRVTGTFVLNETPVLFKMKTTTARLPDYVKYGEVHFTLHGESFVLAVYQSPAISAMEGYEDYLFIPFTDKTNGTETYEVGRYLEVRIPQDDRLIVDFNQAYNPYCSYNNRYSCPIPPEENALPIEIKAGEKIFHKTKK
jgi:uncharacterized protein (DUF1684 family)